MDLKKKLLKPFPKNYYDIMIVGKKFIRCYQKLLIQNFEINLKIVITKVGNTTGL